MNRIYPKDTIPHEDYCSHRYWTYVNKGEDDCEKECCCDIDDEICFGKSACGKLEGASDEDRR